MKSVLKLSLFIFAIFTLSTDSSSLTDNQIKMICKSEKKKLTCIKNLKNKRYNLQKGNLIEIPVIPYRK